MKTHYPDNGEMFKEIRPKSSFMCDILGINSIQRTLHCACALVCLCMLLSRVCVCACVTVTCVCVCVPIGA